MTYYIPDPFLTEDERRIAAIVMIVDGIGDIDLHERAAGYAANRGHEEPTERDYLNAARDAMDDLRAASTTDEVPHG